MSPKKAGRNKARMTSLDSILNAFVVFELAIVAKKAATPKTGADQKSITAAEDATLTIPASDAKIMLNTNSLLAPNNLIVNGKEIAIVVMLDSVKLIRAEASRIFI